ncbi:MAG: GNAT family N-acetyltransferase [bacterium]
MTDSRSDRVRVRRARLGDHLALCELWSQVDALHASIRPDFFTGAGEPARSKLYLDRILSDDAQELLVAVGQETLLGLIHLQIYDTPRTSVFVDRRRAHVEDLVVDEAHRRQGIGTALLRAGESWARRQEAQQLVLTVWTGNESGSDFYASHGYSPVSKVLAKEL